MKISNNSNLEISTKGGFILSGVIVLVGFILLLLDHPVIGVMVFLISSCVFIVQSIITAAKQESGNKAKKAVKGGVAGCGSTLLIIILFVIGMVNLPSINQQSVSNDIQTPISYQDIVETVDSAISNNSETIIKVESNTSSVKNNGETLEKAIHDTESHSKSTLTDTESELSQSKTSKLESKEDYIELVEKSISGAIGKGEKITEVKLDEKTLYINVDIDNTELNAGITIPKEDLAVSRASSITDNVLQLDTSFWNTVVVDFKNIGTVSRKKSEIVHGEYGDYFVIDELDNISKFESKNELEIEKKTETTSSTYIELPSQATIYQIVINEETKKFHLSSCYKTDEILPDHRRVIDITDGSLFEVIQKLENDGYSHCKICLK